MSLTKEAATGGSVGRNKVLRDRLIPLGFWTLDPIDGTSGFLRGGQYAYVWR